MIPDQFFLDFGYGLKVFLILLGGSSLFYGAGAFWGVFIGKDEYYTDIFGVTRKK